MAYTIMQGNPRPLDLERGQTAQFRVDVGADVEIRGQQEWIVVTFPEGTTFPPNGLVRYIFKEGKKRRPRNWDPATKQLRFQNELHLNDDTPEAIGFYSIDIRAFPNATEGKSTGKIEMAGLSASLEVEIGRKLVPFVPPTGPAGLFVKHSNKALDVDQASKKDATAIQQWVWKNVNNQKFRFEAVGDGYYRIIAQHSNKAVAISGPDRTGNGLVVHQWGYQDRDHFKFSFEPVGDGYFRINVKSSGKALCVDDGKSDDGARVVQWDYQDKDHFKWRL